MAAADSTWVGGADGDIGNAANWTGGVPIEGESVILRDSNISLDTNLQTTIHDKNLTTFAIMESFTGNVGGSGNVLLVLSIDQLLMSSGGNECWIDSQIDEMAYCDGRGRGDNWFQFNTANAKTAAKVIVRRGKTTLGANCTATILDIDATDTISDAILVDTVGASVGTMTQSGGLSKMSGAITTSITLNSGHHIHLAGTQALVTVHGGRYQFDGGAITADPVVHGGGYFDCSQSAQTRTFTGGEIDAYTGATLNLRDKTGLLTVNVRIHGEPVILWNDGTTLTPS